ncbi:mannosyltransferase family protein, partial [Streptomyces solincola]|uniref:mannosyltransferase family protein n=1 Tax=Streptomyces solincola TaxID=2100817 RepID=UPI00215993BA
VEQERPPARGPRPPPARRGRWPGPADREALWLYLVTRLALAVTAYCARRLFPADRDARDAGPFLAAFEQWDWGLYLKIARDGYFPGGAGPGTDGWDNREAFLPGFPTVLRAVHAVVPHWPAAGLLVSLAAGAVAVVALARLARSYLPDTGAAGPRRTVLFFLLSPCAVFLAAGYTEALFLALALPAWLAARRGAWPQAAVLTALSATVRVSGLFLAAALLAQFLLTARRPWRQAPWLLLCALPPAAYTAYLYLHTGDWMAWKHAQERGWYRDFHPPWEAWAHTWQAAFGEAYATGYALTSQAELLAMTGGLVLLGVLLWRRQWPESVYLAATLWALGTSFWYTSVPRSTLLWWPLWIGLAALSLRRPRFTTAWLCLTVPLSAALAYAFLTGRWAG